MVKNGKKGIKMETRTRKLNEKSFSKALSSMLKNIKSGELIYIVFSKKSFRILVFTLAMSIIANLTLVYLLVNSLILGGLDVIYIILLVLFVVAIISGLWLVFKGIDIVTDDIEFK